MPDQEVKADGSQSGATWGLDRIDQNALPLNQVYSYSYTGEGVTAYIIDSGIRLDHTDFEGRAVPGFDAIGDGQNGNDCHSHGTHVAGTVGGKTWGVAKKIKLVSVRVLGCDGTGTGSGFIAGIDWVAKNHVKPAVANISIGAGQSTQLNSALQSMIATGVQASVSAGNSDADACNQSPASTPEAITVGATSNSDARRLSSNWGPCVDLFAPGSAITSASHLDPSTLKSGTSMAAPHVAGVAALLLQEDAALTPQQVRDKIWNLSTKNNVTDAKSANAHLLYSRTTTSSTPTAPTAPASLAAKEMTANCVDLSWADQSSNEDGFEIQRKTDSGSYTAIARVAANTTTYADGTTESSKSYTYRVRAYNSGGEAYSNEASVTVSSAPTAPASLAAKVVTLSRVDLSWADQSSNEDGFRIERKTGTGSWGVLAQLGANSTAYSDTSVQKDVTYSYRVIAFNAPGSASSSEVTVKVACKTRPKTTTCQ
jgi:serine protease